MLTNLSQLMMMMMMMMMIIQYTKAVYYSKK
jgi:hypothetical protein